MIKEGDKGIAKYWGKFTKGKAVKLAELVACQSSERGKVLFNPALVQIE